MLSAIDERSFLTSSMPPTTSKPCCGLDELDEAEALALDDLALAARDEPVDFRARTCCRFGFADGRYAGRIRRDELLDVVSAHARRERRERMRPGRDVSAAPSSPLMNFSRARLVFGGRRRRDDRRNLDGLESSGHLGVTRDFGV